MRHIVASFPIDANNHTAYNTTMFNEVNMSDSKSLLAKLLATENITVRRNAQAQTASFDVKYRVLEMPVWHGISSDLEDLLTVHETGHALDTPYDGWIKAIDTIGKKYYTTPTKRQSAAIKGFLNVIEDARIDKRQKRRYPGSRRNYLIGYKELLERGFFGPPSTDYNTYNFIDRINVYFKGGVSLGIKFSLQEMPFVKRIENAETFDDVISLTDEIYSYCKTQGESDQKTLSDMIKSEEEGFESSDEDDEDGEEIDCDDDDVGASSSDDNYDDEDEEESDPKSNQSNSVKQNTKGSSGSEENFDEDFVPESQTEKVWQEKQKELADTTTEYVYITLPKFELKNIVDDYKVFIKENQEKNNNITVNFHATVAQQVKKFKLDENNAISFMVKEFEMKKAADMYSRINISKTGVIDTNKLHSYKYNDDIFRRLTTVPTGKNHGFIMFLDWSGSMLSNFNSTMKQLFSMAMFCKRVQIPFEVYSFRELNYKEKNSYYNESNFFKTVKGNAVLQPFKMRNILSSRMSLNELNAAFNILWRLSVQSNYAEPMSGTPLNAAIVVASELVNQFRQRNKLQVVNTVFLTDGGSNPISGVSGYSSNSWSGSKVNRQYVLQDDVSKREYYLSKRNSYIDGEELTDNLLRILKARTNSNLIGFYLYSSGYSGSSMSSLYRTFFGNVLNQKHYDDTCNMWKNNKFISVTSSGYDQYYVINAKSMSVDKNDLLVNSSMTKSKIAKAFTSFANNRSINRVLLQRFISSIATAGTN